MFEQDLMTVMNHIDSLAKTKGAKTWRFQTNQVVPGIIVEFYTDYNMVNKMEVWSLTKIIQNMQAARNYER